ncbi:TPA: YbjP/YqhG family protein [Citrobacter farmeri]|nr:YbjP/YqhG family protein [Citrobacter farmeri]
MRLILSLLLLLLSGCTVHHDTSSRSVVNQFYLQYMTIYTSDNDESLINYTNPIYGKYVSTEIIQRLKQIDNYYEQEIVNSDYFMYVQDYAPEWIAKFHTGTASAFLGGEKVEVWLGDSSTRLIHLLVYTRREDGQWKIYRVRDLTNQFEHPIYDAGAIARARAWSAEIAPEYELLKK